MSDKYKEIGEILAAARREQQKTIAAASENTKIMTHFLEAVEAGMVDKLPSPAYFNLFARNYAQYLGIDPSIFDEIEEKQSIPDNSPVAPNMTPKTDKQVAENASRNQARKFGRSLIYVVSIIIIIFVAFILYNQWFVKDALQPSEYESSDGYSREVPETTAGSGDWVEFSAPDQPYQHPEKLRLLMNVRQEVWAIIVQDGDTVLNRRLETGEELLWEADYRFELTLGISTAVSLFINDLELAPLTDRARTVSGFEINQINYKDFFVDPEKPDKIIIPAPADESKPQESAPGNQSGQTSGLTDKETSDGD